MDRKRVYTTPNLLQVSLDYSAVSVVCSDPKNPAVNTPGEGGIGDMDLSGQEATKQINNKIPYPSSEININERKNSVF